MCEGGFGEVCARSGLHGLCRGASARRRCNISSYRLRVLCARLCSVDFVRRGLLLLPGCPGRLSQAPVPPLPVLPPPPPSPAALLQPPPHAEYVNLAAAVFLAWLPGPSERRRSHFQVPTLSASPPHARAHTRQVPRHTVFVPCKKYIRYRYMYITVTPIPCAASPMTPHPSLEAGPHTRRRGPECRMEPSAAPHAPCPVCQG